MSAPSTSSLGPWIFLWSYLAILTTGLKLKSSLIAALFLLLLKCFSRVKEIAVGIMANMLCHEKVFLGILDKQRYLEKLLRVLDVKDSPTLSLVFR